MQEALFRGFCGASANPGFQTPSTKACAKLPRCGFRLPRGHRIEYMGVLVAAQFEVTLSSHWRLQKSRRTLPYCPFPGFVFHHWPSFQTPRFLFIFSSLQFRPTVSFSGEPSLFCTSFRATESKCGQMEAAACCSNQVLNPHACYTTPFHIFHANIQSYTYPKWHPMPGS